MIIIKMDMYWFMLVIMVIQTSWSATVKITPENIDVEFGTDSVNFTCRIGFDMIEAAHTNWIIWWKDGTRVADNYYVYLDHAKYSVHDDPSANSTHYTQTLQIHSIIEDDSGTYFCELYIASFPALSSTVARLLITYLDIPQPICFHQTVINSPSQILILCSHPSGYSQTILQWTDNEGNELTTEPRVVQNGNIVLSAVVNIEFDVYNQWFTCRATSLGSTETKECVIGNKQVTMTTSSENNIPMTSTNKIINQSPMPSELIRDQQPVFTSPANLSNTNFSSASEFSNTITEYSMFLVIAVFVFVIYIIVLLRKWKNTKNEEIDLNSCQHGQCLEAANSSNDEVTGANVVTNRIEDNELYNIQFDINQQLEYINSAFEINTDKPDPSYTAINQPNAEEHERHEAKDDYVKFSDQAVGPRNTGQQDHITEHEYQTNIITLHVASELIPTADMEFKRKPPVPAKTKTTKAK